MRLACHAIEYFRINLKLKLSMSVMCILGFECTCFCLFVAFLLSEYFFTQIAQLQICCGYLQTMADTTDEFGWPVRGQLLPVVVHARILHENWIYIRWPLFICRFNIQPIFFLAMACLTIPHNLSLFTLNGTPTSNVECACFFLFDFVFAFLYFYGFRSYFFFSLTYILFHSLLLFPVACICFSNLIPWFFTALSVRA